MVSESRKRLPQPGVARDFNPCQVFELSLTKSSSSLQFSEAFTSSFQLSLPHPIAIVIDLAPFHEHRPTPSPQTSNMGKAIDEIRSFLIPSHLAPPHQPEAGGTNVEGQSRQATKAKSEAVVRAVKASITEHRRSKNHPGQPGLEGQGGNQGGASSSSVATGKHPAQESPSGSRESKRAKGSRGSQAEKGKDDGLETGRGTASGRVGIRFMADDWLLSHLDERYAAVVNPETEMPTKDVEAMFAYDSIRRRYRIDKSEPDYHTHLSEFVLILLSILLDRRNKVLLKPMSARMFETPKSTASGFTKDGMTDFKVDGTIDAVAIANPPIWEVKRDLVLLFIMLRFIRHASSLPSGIMLYIDEDDVKPVFRWPGGDYEWNESQHETAVKTIEAMLSQVYPRILITLPPLLFSRLQVLMT